MSEPQPHPEAEHTEKLLADWRRLCQDCEVMAMKNPTRADLDTEMKAARRLVQIVEAVLQAEKNGRHDEAKELRAQFSALKKRWLDWG
jgi:hypothetical protein